MQNKNENNFLILKRFCGNEKYTVKNPEWYIGKGDGTWDDPDMLCLEIEFGKAVEIKYDAENKAYVEVAEAGIYSVYYSAVDEDGFSAISQVNFMILYDESENNDGLSAWAIVGIVVGSLLVVGAIAWLIVVVVLKKKGKEKFINKARQAKKEKKASDEKEYTSVLYTIVQSKNEAEWTIKKNNRVLAKTSTKEEAISKINEDGDGQKKIKVYNKQGRLIDSID